MLILILIGIADEKSERLLGGDEYDWEDDGIPKVTITTTTTCTNTNTYTNRVVR